MLATSLWFSYFYFDASISSLCCSSSPRLLGVGLDSFGQVSCNLWLGNFGGVREVIPWALSAGMLGVSKAFYELFLYNL